MAWLEIHIETNAQHADRIGETLTDYGAQAITMKDGGNKPIFEPALNKIPEAWPETILIGLFDEREDLKPVVDYLENQQKIGALIQFSLQHLGDEDWERRCLDSFQPIRFGKRLWVCPSWQTPPEPTAVNIILDPGLAFGTGTHPTTALCLEWLDENIHGGETVIDYGCGSGILGIAALKLGAKAVSAVDHDEKALLATEENRQRNGLSEAQLKTFLPPDFIPHSGDLLVANILAQPLIELAPLLSSFTKKGGKILLSGILSQQIDTVARAYEPYFLIQGTDFKGEWSRLTGIRR